MAKNTSPKNKTVGSNPKTKVKTVTDSPNQKTTPHKKDKNLIITSVEDKTSSQETFDSHSLTKKEFKQTLRERFFGENKYLTWFVFGVVGLILILIVPIPKIN